MSYNPISFAGMAIAAVFGFSNVSAAQILFTASGTSTLNYGAWNIPTGTFGFFYDYFDATTVCPACVSASTPDGTPLGTFGLSIGGNYYFSNVGNGTPGAQLIPPSLYYQTLVPFGGGTYGFSMHSATGGPYLLQGQETGYTVFGTVGLNSATIEINLTNATSQVISGLPSTVYLDITRDHQYPHGCYPLFRGNPSGVLFSGFTMDWTATLSDTSLLNSHSNPFGLSASSANATAGGGPGSVNVISTAQAAPWTAVSNASFITITSGASGMGNGTVSYSVASNSGAQRAWRPSPSLA